jgi:pentatricopeptide repeat protein
VYQKGEFQIVDLERKNIFTLSWLKSFFSETAYAAYIHALNLNNKYDEALNLLREMVDQETDNRVKVGIGCFNACILNALKSGRFEDVIEIDKMMEKARVGHNGTTFQGLILARARLGDKESLRKTVEDAIKHETPIDYETFASCLKFLLPQLCDSQTLDISKIRTTLRHMVENDERVSSEAMELNRSLMNCLREDSRVPSKIKNKQQIFKLRNELWRIALKNVLTLSAKI